MSSISPMGNQDKFYDTGTDRWYKADHLGYEGLSEYVVSELLKHSRIRNQHFAFVRYSMCHFKIGNKQMTVSIVKISKQKTDKHALGM